MPRPAIELVVTDLDGTFWTHGGVVAPDTWRALAALEARGVAVLVATGRRIRSASLALTAANLERLPVVGLNGSVGVEAGAIFHRRCFTPVAAREVLDAYLAEGVVPVAYTAPTADSDCLIAAGVSTHPEHLAVLAPTMRAIDSWDEVDDHEVIAFSVLGLKADVLSPIYEKLREVAAAVMSPDRAYGNHNLAVTPYGVHKWDGVLSYCERRGIDPDRVLAIGDDDNDVEMIASASIGLAMSHAPSAVRAAAHATVDCWSDVVNFV